MVKKKEGLNRFLLILLNLLLSALVSIMFFGGKIIIENQVKTITAVNNLKIVLVEHSQKIGVLEKNDEKQDGEIKE